MAKNKNQLHVNSTLSLYTSALVDEFARHNLTKCVISPGSRSTPLAILMAEHPDLEIYINVDERSAGFFALGAAKESGKPTLLLCTSGTAAANYLPAIVEAYYARVPLIVLTSDRPPELREVGAPQAIKQLGIYGGYAKEFFEAALPEEGEKMAGYARNLVRRSIATALQSPAGPVHINIPFREPLLPDIEDPRLFTYGRSPHPYQFEHGRRILADEVFTLVAKDLCGVERGIIVCGPQEGKAFPAAVIHLAKKLQFPILADPLSKIRQWGIKSPWIIDGYDAFLRSEEVLTTFKPDVILRFGAMPISKPFYLALEKSWRNIKQILVDGGGKWRDPVGNTTNLLYCDETLFCEEISHRLTKLRKTEMSLLKEFLKEATIGETRLGENPVWGKRWKEVNQRTLAILAKIGQIKSMNEGRVIYELNELLPDRAILYVANSMPIRDVDTFIHQREKQIDILCNRGANGIDGTISSAMGASLSGKPTLLVTGDLSFFHDLNGLAAASLNRIKLTIILINNNGGGIFSFLPQAQEPSIGEHFERLFLTPLHLSFEYAAKLYGATYNKAKTWEEFRTLVGEALKTEGVNIIEVRTEREENVSIHRQLWQEVSQEMKLLCAEYGVGVD